MAKEAGRKDPGVVDYQDVIRIQPPEQVPEMPVSEVIPVPLQHQQAGGVPLLQRVLSYQLRGQKIIVVLNQGHSDINRALIPKPIPVGCCAGRQALRKRGVIDAALYI
jgi:hypothetical protein